MDAGKRKKGRGVTKLSSAHVQSILFRYGLDEEKKGDTTWLACRSTKEGGRGKEKKHGAKPGSRPKIRDHQKKPQRRKREMGIVKNRNENKKERKRTSGKKQFKEN